MLNPLNVPPVDDDETLARYVLQSNHFRSSDGTAKGDVFMPHPYQDLSVTRHREATEEEIWGVGHSVAQNIGKTLYGRFDIQAKDFLIDSLKVIPDPTDNNPNHAIVIGWPEAKQDQKSISQQIAANLSNNPSSCIKKI
jgi:hypothetical protein